jgi:hypothetical protein
MSKFLAREALSIRIPGNTGKMYEFSMKEPTVVTNPRDVARFRNTSLLKEIDDAGAELNFPSRIRPAGHRDPSSPLSFKKMRPTVGRTTITHPAKFPAGSSQGSGPAAEADEGDDEPTDEAQTTGSFTCPDCGKVLGSEKGLEIHRKRLHP